MITELVKSKFIFVHIFIAKGYGSIINKRLLSIKTYEDKIPQGKDNRNTISKEKKRCRNSEC